MGSSKSIITPAQKTFLAEFSKTDLRKIFYFTGGTALSEYYLHHRLSEDLDFFCEQEFSHEKVNLLINKISLLLKSQKVLFEKKNGRDIFNLIFEREGGLKIEFVHYPYKNLRPLEEFDGISVNSKFDITVNKVFSVFTRNEPKDFVDLYFLLKAYKLEKLLSGVEKKFGVKLSKFTLGNEFFKAKHITQIPKMIKKVGKEEIISYFMDLASELGTSLFY